MHGIGELIAFFVFRQLGCGEVVKKAERECAKFRWKRALLDINAEKGRHRAASLAKQGEEVLHERGRPMNLGSAATTNPGDGQQATNDAEAAAAAAADTRRNALQHHAGRETPAGLDLQELTNRLAAAEARAAAAKAQVAVTERVAAEQMSALRTAHSEGPLKAVFGPLDRTSCAYL
eukprot:SAG31_NODE_1912_length_6935_cov_40.528525_5_plen_177_part_00